MEKDIAFEMAASTVRYGAGVTGEVRMDLAALGARRVLVLTDRVLKRLPPVQAVVADSLERQKTTFVVYDRVRVEPTDEPMPDAVAFAREGECPDLPRASRARRPGRQSAHRQKPVPPRAQRSSGS